MEGQRLTTKGTWTLAAVALGFVAIVFAGAANNLGL